MKISIIGMGWVGSAFGQFLKTCGHEVVGFDVLPEKGLPLDVSILKDSDLVFVCVQTPSKADGTFDTSFLESVAKELPPSLPLVIRSTVIPGTTERIFGLGACYWPESMREGHEQFDQQYAKRLVFGQGIAADPGVFKKCSLWLNYKWERFFIKTSVPQAELVKLVDNSWHALKVCWGNEMGRVAEHFGVDPKETLEIFKADTKLNCSGAYLKPGFAFGGSCLPKDLGALVVSTKELNLPLLRSVGESNGMTLLEAASEIQMRKPKKVGFYGLSFKPEVEDFRGSPFLKLAEAMRVCDYEVALFDPNSGFFSDPLEDCDVVVTNSKVKAEENPGWLYFGHE